MKYIFLILLFCSSFAIADAPSSSRAELSSLNQGSIEIEDIKTPVKSMKHKHRLNFYKDEKNDSKKADKKIKKFLKKIKHVLFHDHKGKKKKQDFELREIENDNVNLLTIELDSKDFHHNQEKYIPHSIKYKIYLDKQRILKEYTKDLYEVEGLMRFDVNIADLELGDYKLALQIFSEKAKHDHHKKGKKGKGRGHKHEKKKKDHISYASIDFTKEYYESAIAVLDLVSALPGNYRVTYSMANSSSGLGAITEYTVRLYRGSELLDEFTQDPSIATEFSYSFDALGDYQIELEVSDGTDTDITRSETITPDKLAPKLEFNLSQNQNYPDIFSIDFTGSTAPTGAVISGYLTRVYQNGQIIEQKFSNQPIFDFQTNARGEFSILALVLASDGTNNFELKGPFNLAPDFDSSIFLNYSHRFIDENNPRRMYLAFTNQVSQEDFKQWNVTVTNLASGASSSYASTPYIFDDFILHALVGIVNPGEYKFEVELELQDGRKSAPYITTQNFDFDLGVASLNVEINKVDGVRTWNINPENSNPGNYGFFTEANCEFSHPNQTLGLSLLGGAFDVGLSHVGTWNVSCFARTNLNLTASYNATIEVENVLPQVSFSITEQNTSKREYRVNLSVEDNDSGIDSSILTLNKPDGSTENINAFDGLLLYLTQVGSYGVSLTVNDSDGGTVTQTSPNIVIINSKPTASFNITLLDQNTRNYQFIGNWNDTDGYIQNIDLSYTTPSGALISLSPQNNQTLTLAQAGVYTFGLIVQDNDGESSDLTTQTVTVTNQAPEVALLVEAIDENNRTYRIAADSSDIDGYVIRTKLDVVFADGSIYSFEGVDYLEQIFSQVGTYQVSYQAQDNDGLWSELKTISVNITNKQPIAAFEITQVSSDRYYFVIQNSFDLDGYLVEYEFKLTSPSGIVTTKNEVSNFEVQLSELGSWSIDLRVLDNERSWSETVSQSISSNNSAPVAEYEIALDNNTKTVNVIANATDSDGEIVSHSFKATHTDGSIVEESFIESSFSVQLTKVGDWSVELQVFDNDGGVSLIYTSSLTIDFPLVPPFASFSCEQNRNNIVTCVNNSYDTFRDVINYKWTLDGNIIELENSDLVFEASEERDYTIGLSAINSAELVGTKESVFGVNYLYTNLLSDIGITFDISNEFFQDKNSNLTLSFDKSYLNEETYNNLVVTINGERVFGPDFILFEGNIQIPFSNLINGENTISVTGLDIYGNEIEFDGEFLSGEVQLAYSSETDSITKITLIPLENDNLSYNFYNTSVIEFVPNGEYFVTVNTASGVFSEFVSVENLDYQKTINLNNLAPSSLGDLNMENGLAGWESIIGGHVIVEEGEGANTYNSLQVSPDSSSVGQSQKRLILNSGQAGSLNYSVSFNSKGKGDRFYVVLTSLVTGKQVIVKHKSISPGEYLGSISLPTLGTDEVLIDVFVQESSTNQVVKKSNKFSLIESAYAADTSGSANARINGVEHILKFNLLNLGNDYKSKKRDYRPSGISIGEYRNLSGDLLFETHDDQGNEIPSNPFLVEIESTKSLEELEGDFEVEIQFSLRKGSVNNSTLLDLVIKKQDVSSLQFLKMENNKFYYNYDLRLLEGDFKEEFYKSTEPDYVTVTACMQDKTTKKVIGVICSSILGYNGVRKLDVLNRFDESEVRRYSTSVNEDATGGDFWIDNKIYPYLLNWIRANSKNIMINDLARMNGGYFAPHENHIGRSFDFIVTKDNQDSESLRHLYEGENVIMQNIETAEILDRVMSGNNSYLLRHKKRLIGPLRVNNLSGAFDSQERKLVSSSDFDNYNNYMNSSCNEHNLSMLNLFTFRDRDHNNHFHFEFDKESLDKDNSYSPLQLQSISIFNTLLTNVAIVESSYKKMSAPSDIIEEYGRTLSLMANIGNSNFIELDKGPNFEQKVVMKRTDKSGVYDFIFDMKESPDFRFISQMGEYEDETGNLRNYGLETHLIGIEPKTGVCKAFFASVGDLKVRSLANALIFANTENDPGDINSPANGTYWYWKAFSTYEAARALSDFGTGPSFPTGHFEISGGNVDLSTGKEGFHFSFSTRERLNGVLMGDFYAMNIEDYFSGNSDAFDPMFYSSNDNRGIWYIDSISAQSKYFFKYEYHQRFELESNDFYGYIFRDYVNYDIIDDSGQAYHNYTPTGSGFFYLGE